MAMLNAQMSQVKLQIKPFWQLVVEIAF
jgi:hypothetical protein